MAGPETYKTKELLEIAQRFRKRAAECRPSTYRDLMFRTARELEEIVEALTMADKTDVATSDVSKTGTNS
ncbi:MAG: hypothetical protein KGL29_04570 [Alphaproteobacteria bacterium]|nr:hypothetical protein [Alphaproteobacteria bacterium]MDE2265150.1 hypothetical protein [Alphaproteobacteria bacterium]